MQRYLLALAFLVVVCARLEARCIDAATLTHSTASIMRLFDDEEQKAQPGVLGVRGTGWFLAPNLMVTVAHVAAGMKLSDQDWKQIELGKVESKRAVHARIRRLAGSHKEKIAVLELQAALPGAVGIPIRTEPLAPEEPVASVGYPDGRLRVAGGRFVQYGDSDKFAGTALFELFDGEDRLALDHGASGAPVLDCSGRVVAVVSNLLATNLQFMSRTVRISTAWGSPNVVSLPVPVLQEESRLQ